MARNIITAILSLVIDRIAQGMVLATKILQDGNAETGEATGEIVHTGPDHRNLGLTGATGKCSFAGGADALAEGMLQALHFTPYSV